MDDREQQIRDRAHAIWERRGRPHGRDLENWLEAQAEIADEDIAANEAVGSNDVIEAAGIGTNSGADAAQDDGAMPVAKVGAIGLDANEQHLSSPIEPEPAATAAPADRKRTRTRGTAK